MDPEDARAGCALACGTRIEPPLSVGPGETLHLGYRVTIDALGQGVGFAVTSARVLPSPAGTASKREDKAC